MERQLKSVSEGAVERIQCHDDVDVELWRVLSGFAHSLTAAAVTPGSKSGGQCYDIRAAIICAKVYFVILTAGI